MGTKIVPFLMFEGKAGAAMDFYVSLFENGKILRAEKYGKGEPGPEGSIKVATFRIGSQEVMCSDSPVQHGFTFTASTSLFVTCESEAQIDDLYKKLSQGGQVFMELGAYPFSRKFAWVADKFGVSWQLSLPKE